MFGKFMVGECMVKGKLKIIRQTAKWDLNDTVHRDTVRSHEQKGEHHTTGVLMWEIFILPLYQAVKAMHR
jgi:hypothetical protein